MIYKLEGRVSKKSISIYISDRDKFAFAKGNDQVSVVAVEDEYGRKEYELLDYRGNPLEALVSEKMRRSLEKIDPDGVYYQLTPEYHSGLDKAVLNSRPETILDKTGYPGERPEFGPAELNYRWD